jgi:hypothetical protein
MRTSLSSSSTGTSAHRGVGIGLRDDAAPDYAVYLVPVDLWYIPPFEAARKTSVSVQFPPDRAGHKYEKYLEAWHLLRE